MKDPNKQFLKKMPLNCPFCDEAAYPSPNKHRLVTPYKIYTWRTCIMGHDLVSVEEICEDQSSIIKEMGEVRKSMLEMEREDEDM